MPMQVNEQTVTDWDSVNYQSTQHTEKEQSTQNVQGQQNFKGIIDETSNLGGVWTNIPYLANISFPVLVAVTYGLSDQTNGMHEETQYSPESAYFDSFAENLENLIQKYDLSEEQVNKLVMLFMTDAPSDDTFLNEALAELDTAIVGDMAASFDLPSTSDQGRHLKERAKSHMGAVKESISELQAYADSLSDESEKQHIQQQINELKKNINGFREKLGTLSDSPSREELANLAKELSLSGEQLKQIAANSSHLIGSNPVLRNILANVESSLGNSVESLNGILQELVVSWQISTGDYNSFTESFKETFINKLTYEFDNALESALEKFTDDPALQAKLRYAHYNPESATGDLKAVLQQVQQNAVNQLKAEGWAIPEGYMPPSDGSSFQVKMLNSSDNMFEAALETYVGADGKALNLEQQNIIRNMYYGIIPADGDLGTISAELEAQVASELSVAFGLPDGFPVPKGSFSRAANINGQFQMKFLELLDNLSPDQKAAVLQAIKNPLGDTSSETKTLLNELFHQALGSIRSQFSLPDNWTPPLGVLKEINNLSWTQKSAAKTITEWDEGVRTALALTLSQSNDPNQATILNVLKIISQAISELKEQIAIMLQLDAQVSQKTGKAQLEASLAKVKKQQDALDEIKEKREKMQDLGPLFSILKVVQLVMTVVMGIFAGPLGLLIAVIAIVDTFSGTDESTLTKMFTEIANGIMKALTPLIGRKAADAVGMVTNAMICLALVASGAFMIGIQVMFENSGIIQTFFTDICGFDEMVGEMVAMISQLVFELVVGVVMTVVTGGAAAAGLVAQFMGKVAAYTSKAVNGILKVLQMVMNQLLKISKLMNKFAKVSKTLAKVAKQIEKLGENLKKLAEKFIRWSKKLMERAKDVQKYAKDVSWKKQLIAQFSKNGTTNAPAFDMAFQAYRESIDLITTVMTLTELATLGVQTYTSVVQVKNSVLRAEIAEIQGDMESVITELEAYVKSLKKMLAKLLEGLTSSSQWIAQIGQQQSSMWKEYSSTLDAVASANQAG